jgi:hypothetical protein
MADRNFELSSTPEERCQHFLSLRDLRDIADLLEINYDYLVQYTREIPLSRQYVIYNIPKKSGSFRTKYLIERRWCPGCHTYQEDTVTAALPGHRRGLHVLLLVVYQKVALGLSYRKIQHELRSYFGLRLSVGQLPSLVAEVAALFGPA